MGNVSRSCVRRRTTSYQERGGTPSSTSWRGTSRPPSLWSSARRSPFCPRADSATGWWRGGGMSEDEGAETWTSQRWFISCKKRLFSAIRTRWKEEKAPGSEAVEFKAEIETELNCSTSSDQQMATKLFYQFISVTLLPSELMEGSFSPFAPPQRDIWVLKSRWGLLAATFFFLFVSFNLFCCWKCGDFDFPQTSGKMKVVVP